VAHLAHHIGIAAKMFNYSMRFEPKFDDYRHELLPDFASLVGGGANLNKHILNEKLNSISALKEFTTKPPRPYLPLILRDSLKKARTELDIIPQL
jgi:hypothetical protein